MAQLHRIFALTAVGLVALSADALGEARLAATSAPQGVPSEKLDWSERLANGQLDIPGVVRWTQQTARNYVALASSQLHSEDIPPTFLGKLFLPEPQLADVLTHRPVDGDISSEFGRRRDPMNRRRSKEHRGLDIAADRGTPVFAAGPGIVTRAHRERGYGRVVYVQHGDDLETRYAHLQSISVSVGEFVAAGALVGKVGSSGRATGPHLHFEIRTAGQPVSPTKVSSLSLFDPPPTTLAALGRWLDTQALTDVKPATVQTQAKTTEARKTKRRASSRRKRPQS